MPIQYELRRLFHFMNIQTHRNSTQKALILGAYFNSWLRFKNVSFFIIFFPVGYSKVQSVCVSQNSIKTLFFAN